MATRCTITVRDKFGREYRIYRHGDGHPEGVVSDLYLLTQFYNRSPIEDPEYFLANFIFYAKLSLWVSEHDEFKRHKNPLFRGWEYGYGVCASNGEPNNREYKSLLPRELDYKYLIYPFGSKVMLKIERFSYESMNFKEIFNDKIEKAFEKWAKSEGCHLKPELLY